MPMWIGEPGETPIRPWAVWVSRETEMVNVKLAEGPPAAGLALDVFVDLGLRFMRTPRPARIEVVDPALGDRISRGTSATPSWRFTWSTTSRSSGTRSVSTWRRRRRAGPCRPTPSGPAA